MPAPGMPGGWDVETDGTHDLNVERKTEEEGFLSRWSRRKTDAREQPPEAAKPAAPQAESADAAPLLQPLDELTFDSDFRGFFHPKVDEDLRRSALRKLFSDPHFNVMDGLDVYIDDYSKSEPIPAAMLASLKQAQRILRWAEGKDDEEETTPHDAQGAEAGNEQTAGPALEGMQAEPAEPEAPIADASQRKPIVSRPE